MKLEVIATSVTDAVTAQENGADRIELISGICEGGVTPSIGLMEEVLAEVTIPVHIMVRPHANGFQYRTEDLRTMKRDIQCIEALGASGIVLGALTSQNEIDHHALTFLLHNVSIPNVTFHRAFDQITNQVKALEELLTYPAINRILTSGGKPSALQATSQIRQLVQKSANTHITILAGSGLTLPALPSFIEETNVREIHLGTGVRMNNNPLELVDPHKIQMCSKLLKSYV